MPDAISDDGDQESADAALAAAILAVDPHAIGGVLLRAAPGPARESWLKHVQSLLQTGAPFRRLPINASDERLLGGLDLSATIAAGRPIAQRGIMAETDGGILVAPCAERLSSATASRIACVLDLGEVLTERDGLALRHRARLGVIAVDESCSPDEHIPHALAERLAIHLTLDDGFAPGIDLSATVDLDRARSSFRSVSLPERAVEALCGVALAFGIASPLAPILASRVARIAAALANREMVSDADVGLAARVVLAPRATIMPVESESEQPEPAPGDAAQSAEPAEGGALEDVIVAAVKAAIPAQLLARLETARAGRQRNAASGRAGAQQKAPRRGRQVGTRRGTPSASARLDLIDTLRAAAPWQRIRRPDWHARDTEQRIAIRADDFRVKRLKHRAETTTIFIVDASGSTALHRLGEAKGAVELLLADCYVRRDQVALIAFSGRGAELLLPPTRSLARARRNLADLPGGGATPLASGIDAAAALADTVKRKGQTPGIVLLTDGRANLGRDGKPGRAQAHEDAISAARAVRSGSFAAIVIDTSRIPEPQAALVADAMGAHYVPLPHADARSLADAVQREMGGRRG